MLCLNGFPPGTPVSSTRKLISSSCHRLDMTLAVAEALTPNRRGSRIQKGGGGVRTFRRGGFVQEFQEGIQIVAGPWANQQANKNCRQPWGGGGPMTQKPPVSAHAQ